MPASPHTNALNQAPPAGDSLNRVSSLTGVGEDGSGVAGQQQQQDGVERRPVEGAPHAGERGEEAGNGLRFLGTVCSRWEQLRTNIHLSIQIKIHLFPNTSFYLASSLSSNHVYFQFYLLNINMILHLLSLTCPSCRRLLSF